MFEKLCRKFSQRKFLLTLGVIATIWLTPIPIEMKVLRTVQAVIAYITIEGIGDAAERFGNGKKEPTVTKKKAA